MFAGFDALVRFACFAQRHHGIHHRLQLPGAHVLEDLDQGLRTLTALSGELQATPGSQGTMAEAMLRRALSLRGVHGSALWLESVEGGRFVQGAGIAAPDERQMKGAR